jgi:uncharacterized protein YjgD (DUF1641 family)
MTTEALHTDPRLEAIYDQVQILVEEAEERRRTRAAMSELTRDMSPIASQGLDAVTRVMTSAEARGYTGFARSSLAVVDRVVTSFSEEDVEALGDNIVLILETVKEMTQPEVMSLLRSTLQNVHDTPEPAEPPSIISLLGQMREPEVRRGLARLIVFLRGLGNVHIETAENRKEAQR